LHRAVWTGNLEAVLLLIRHTAGESIHTSAASLHTPEAESIHTSAASLHTPEAVVHTATGSLHTADVSLHTMAGPFHTAETPSAFIHTAAQTRLPASCEESRTGVAAYAKHGVDSSPALAPSLTPAGVKPAPAKLAPSIQADVPDLAARFKPNLAATSARDFDPDQKAPALLSAALDLKQNVGRARYTPSPELTRLLTTPNHAMESPIYLCALRGHAACGAALLQAGGCELFLGASYHDGWTPLHAAVISRKDEMLNVLLANGKTAPPYARCRHRRAHLAFQTEHIHFQIMYCPIPTPLRTATLWHPRFLVPFSRLPPLPVLVPSTGFSSFSPPSFAPSLSRARSPSYLTPPSHTFRPYLCFLLIPHLPPPGFSSLSPAHLRQSLSASPAPHALPPLSHAHLLISPCFHSLSRPPLSRLLLSNRRPKQVWPDAAAHRRSPWVRRRRRPIARIRRFHHAEGRAWPDGAKGGRRVVANAACPQTHPLNLPHS
jgi:ankyrin repeat protein